jgi:uncharacterized membrane protein
MITFFGVSLLFEESKMFKQRHEKIEDQRLSKQSEAINNHLAKDGSKLFFLTFFKFAKYQSTIIIIIIINIIII